MQRLLMSLILFFELRQEINEGITEIESFCF